MATLYVIVAASLALLLIITSTTSASAEKNASEIPRENTPAPGPWPQSNTTGCGFPGLPITNVLAECTEELDPSAPDIRGYWKTPEGEIDELIEMCGSRWIDTSKSIIHDFPVCTGTVGDGNGCHDYSGPDIIRNDTACVPIITACKFERDDNDNKCVNLYAANGPNGEMSMVVSRCLQTDGTMIWVHPIAGTVVYSKVTKEEEPNCMVCFGGDHDGVTVTDASDELPCPYEERRWKRCDTKEEEGGTKHSAGYCMSLFTFGGMMLPFMLFFDI